GGKTAVTGFASGRGTGGTIAGAGGNVTVSTGAGSDIRLARSFDPTIGGDNVLIASSGGAGTTGGAINITGAIVADALQNLDLAAAKGSIKVTGTIGIVPPATTLATSDPNAPGRAPGALRLSGDGSTAVEFTGDVVLGDAFIDTRASGAQAKFDNG